MSDAAFKKEGQTCCLCIPIQTGMKVMAILSVIGAVLTIIQGVLAISTSPGNGVMYIIQSLLPLWVSFQWFQWLKEDNQDTTASLVKWMRIQFFVNSALVILVNTLILLGVFEVCPDDANKELCEEGFRQVRSSLIFPVIVQTALVILLMYYFYNVTRRYQEIFHS